jgi:AraC-like DNA-binding protein
MVDDGPNAISSCIHRLAKDCFASKMSIMKPHFLKVAVGTELSFSVRRDVVPFFYNRLHFHPEIELVYIHKGTGTQFIGSTVTRFAPGNLIMVGSNLPHMWGCDPVYFEAAGDGLSAEATVVHFHPNFLGDSFFNLPEHRSYQLLLAKSMQGLRVAGKTKVKVVELMHRLSKAKVSDRVLLLLLILRQLAQSTETNVIATTDFTAQLSISETSRLNNIYQYILQNFHESISLEKVASIAHISPRSFCRYFKLHTQKTFSGFLIEVRIAHACKLLQQEDKTVCEVCYECGFNNLSNFYRLFRKQMNITPLDYKRKVSQSMPKLFSRYNTDLSRFGA